MNDNGKTYNCMVTGGAGFIGSHIVEGLLELGCMVTVLDNLSTGTLDNLNLNHPDLTFIEGDILNQDQVIEVSKGMDVIYHEAALTSVSESMKDPYTTLNINANGTLNVLEAARINGVDKVAYASSASVYGKNANLPLKEDMAAHPVSPYGISKLVGEHYCEEYARNFKVKTLCFRYFNVFGPRQHAESEYSGVISIFTKKVLNGENLTIFGDGEQHRDFIHIDDIKQANLLALQELEHNFGVYNVSRGRSVSLLGLVDHLENIVGHKINLDFKPERRGDIRNSLGDIQNIREALGFLSKMSLENGLRDYINYVERSIRLEKAPHRA